MIKFYFTNGRNIALVKLNFYNAKAATFALSLNAVTRGLRHNGI